VRGKTDQEAAGQIVGVVATGSPTCPVAALRTWLEAAAITDGAVSRAIDRHGRIACHFYIRPGHCADRQAARRPIRAGWVFVKI
jgi:hypothetical protein